MKINTSEWLVGFGLWAGAWAMFNLVSGIFFELQVGLIQENGPNQTFVSLRDIPLLGGAIVLMLASNLTVKSHSKLLVLFSVFSAAFLYFDFVYWVTYVLLCEGPECLTSMSYQSPFASVISFDWEALASELGGYLAGWTLLVLFSAPEKAGRRALSSLMKWLQVDTVMYAKFWRWWLSLPLWTYAQTVKVGLGQLWIGVCCIAAAEYVFGGISIVLGSFGHLVGANGDQSNIGLAAVYVYTFSIWAIVSYAVGRITSESGFQVNLLSLFTSGALINVFEIYYSSTELWNTHWSEVEVQTLYAIMYLPVSLVWAVIFAYWGMRRARAR